LNIDEEITKTEGQVAEGKEQNVEELDKKINEEKEKIVLLIQKLGSETLTSKATSNKEALDELGKVKKKNDECLKKLNQYKGF
jgi:hypothetical protein